MSKLNDQILWYSTNHEEEWVQSIIRLKIMRRELEKEFQLIDINSVEYKPTLERVQLIDMIQTVKTMQHMQRCLTVLNRMQERVTNGGKYMHGICAELWLSVNDSSIVKELAPSWKHYSGDKDFPVPGIDHSPKAAFYTYGSFNMWDLNHPYGAMRRDLLKYLIDTITKRIEDYNDHPACSSHTK